MATACETSSAIAGSGIEDLTPAGTSGLRPGQPAGRTDARIEQIDSVRGLAALSVLICHNILVYRSTDIAYERGPAGLADGMLFFPPVYLIWAGHPAVILFFVLSGYVLALPILRGRGQPYAKYAAGRFCRIYLPYAASVAAAMLGAILLSRGHCPTLSTWLHMHWMHQPGLREVIDHVLLIGDFPEGNYNSVIWSLIHEMRISLAFPLIALMVKRWWWPWSLAMACLLSPVGWFGPKLLGLRPGWLPSTQGDYGLTVHYVAFFILGAVLAKHRRPIEARLRDLTPAARSALVVGGLLLYVSEGLHWTMRIGWLRHPSEYLAAAGAVMMISIAPSIDWLRAAPLVRLGRISYSLYLWHIPVMLAVFHLGLGHLPRPILSLLSVAGGVATASAMFRWVELPSMHLARRIVGRGLALPSLDGFEIPRAAPNLRAASGAYR